MDFEHEFTKTEFSSGKITHDVWVGGSGVPVLLLHELDGFGRPFIQLAERLAGEFRVYAPLFFGRVGEPSLLGQVKGVMHICLRREFVAFRLGIRSPVTDWIRDLADLALKDTQDCPGVGIIGMCMTGSIVLATIAEPAAIAAAVSAQPSLPFHFGCFSSMERRRNFGMSAREIADAAAANKPILTLRFGGDRICPEERIEAVTSQLPSATAPPDYLKPISDHPTLTAAYRPKSSDKTRNVSERAIAQTIAFLHAQLRESGDETDD